MSGCTSCGFLELLYLVVGITAAYGIAVNVYETLTSEKAVDFLALCRQHDPDIGNLRPAGSEKQSGSHSELGVNLAQNLKALFAACCAYADYITGFYRIGVD